MFHCHVKLTLTQAASGKGRGGVYFRSAGQMLEADPGRLEGRCRRLYYRSPAGPHTVSLLWTEAWRVWIGKEPGSGLGRPHHLGLEHSVWHCEEKEKCYKCGTTKYINKNRITLGNSAYYEIIKRSVNQK